MQQPSPVISKVEHVLFEFVCCINDLCSLKNELSIIDLDKAAQNLNRLREELHEKQRQRINALYAIS